MMMTSEIKVGIFVIAAAVLMAAALFLLGDYSFKSYYHISAEFSDVTGLPDKAIVKLSGVQVGKIRKIYIHRNKVVVDMAISEGVKIYNGATFLVGATSMIGSKFLQINQGDPALGEIEAGALVSGTETQTLEYAVTKALNNIDSLIKEIRGDGKLGNSVQDVLDNLREMTANLNQMVAYGRPHFEKSIEKIETITARLDEILAKTDELVTKVNNGDGVAGALISDKRMKQDVSEAISSLKEASASVKNSLGKINKVKTFINADYKYEPALESGKADVGIKIYPRDGRYYYAGGANILNTKDQHKGNEYEKINTVDALLGWELGAFDFYGGILRGSAGAGIKYRPLYEKSFDRLLLFAEGSEFGRDRNVTNRHLDAPRYDVGVQVNLNKYVSTGVRLNDLLETKRVNYTFRLYFEDKDISSMLGFASLGAMAK